MKLGSSKYFFSFFILLFSFQILFPANTRKTKYSVLKNGMKIFLEERDSIPLVNLAIAVNVGSKDENSLTKGLVHILEHLILFRGTKNYSGDQIAEEMRKLGAYFNGHTDHDLTTFEISVPSDNIDFALNILKEVVFNLKLSQDELDKEKEVILEEISQENDDPCKIGTILALQNLFKNHAYESPIYGDKEIVKNATCEQVNSFYEHFYTPSNSSLSVVGDFNINEIKGKIGQIFGVLKKKVVKDSNISIVSKLNKSIEVKKVMDIKESYLIIGFLAPELNSKDEVGMRVLTQVLGRGINPLLGTILRGRRRLAEDISMQYIALKYGGVALIKLKLEQKNIKMAKIEVLKFLNKSNSFLYSSEDYLPKYRSHVFDFLEAAKNQIILRSESLKEKGLNSAVSYARYMLLLNPSEKKSYYDRIKKVSSSKLRKISSRYLIRKKFVVIPILPLNEKK